MKCLKCGKENCSCGLSDQLNIHFPCGKCNFNQPVFGDPLCTYPALHGRVMCPFVTPEEHARLENRDKELRKKYGKSWDEEDPLVDGIISAIREFDTGNAKKGKDVIIVE